MMFDNLLIWAHLSGFIAMCFSISAWQFKKQEHILLCYIPSGFFWSIQFFLLGAYSAALFSFFCMFKDGALAKLPEKYFKTIVAVFFGINLIAVSILYQSIFDIIPLAIVLIINIPLMKKDNRYWVVRSNILAQCCWIIFNIHSGAFMGMICASFIIISSFIGMARHEKWAIGKCYKSFLPSLTRSLFLTPRTFP